MDNECRCAWFAIEECRTPRASVLVYEWEMASRAFRFPVGRGYAVYITHNRQGLFALGEGAVPLRTNVTGTGKVERCKTFDHRGWSDLVRIVHAQKSCLVERKGGVQFDFTWRSVNHKQEQLGVI